MKLFKESEKGIDYTMGVIVIIILFGITFVAILGLRSIREKGRKEIYGIDISKILEGFGLEMGPEDREPVGEEIAGPTDLTESKTYYLGEDLSCSGTCIEIKADDVTLNGNGKKITSSNEEGIYIDGQSSVTLKNLIVKNCGDEGNINVEDSNHITIKDSTISSSDSGDGIDFFDTRDSTIKGNTIKNNYAAGVRLAGWSPGSNGNTVKGNTVNNNDIGIRVRDESSDNTINNNEICGNSAYDLWATGGSGNSGSNVCSASNSDIGSGNSVDCGGGSC